MSARPGAAQATYQPVRVRPNLEWQERAACVHADPELFAADESRPDAVMDAKRVCRTCPVIDECLAHAIAFGEPGVWGATTATERAVIKRGHKPKPPRPKCVTCGGDVTGHGRRLYCSKECSRKRVCGDCGRSFRTSGDHRPRFCSGCRRTRRQQAAAS